MNMDIKHITVKERLDNMYEGKPYTSEDLVYILENIAGEDVSYLYDLAVKVKQEHYGNKVFLRGIVEFTNYCKQDCHYCGIRCGNKNVTRYRLSKEQILACCRQGYDLGMRTFVLQGGEDPYYNDERMVDIIKSIKGDFPDCAVTISIGERSRESYETLFAAGGDRFLLREETSNPEHYRKLHPKGMELETRVAALKDLKAVGFNTGGGFMVGSPYQTNEDLAKDLMFLKELQPHMVGIGPFIPHNESIFKDFSAGTLEKTLIMVALTRLVLPKALLPSTTALETISKNGRIKGFLAGANVIMVNVSPADVKKDYLLYNDKAFINTDAQSSVNTIKSELASMDMELAVSIGAPVL